MACDKNPCWKALDKCELHLLKIFEEHLEENAHFLKDAQILHYELYKEVTDPCCHHSREEKAKLIYTRLMDIVEQEEKYYFKFIDYLCTKSKYDELVKITDEAYNGKYPPPPSQSSANWRKSFVSFLKSILIFLFGGVFFKLLNLLYDITFQRTSKESTTNDHKTKREPSSSCGLTDATLDVVDCGKRTCSVNKDFLIKLVEHDVDHEENKNLKAYLGICDSPVHHNKYIPTQGARHLSSIIHLDSKNLTSNSDYMNKYWLSNSTSMHTGVSTTAFESLMNNTDIFSTLYSDTMSHFTSAYPGVSPRALQSLTNDTDIFFTFYPNIMSHFSCTGISHSAWSLTDSTNILDEILGFTPKHTGVAPTAWSPISGFTSMQTGVTPTAPYSLNNCTDIFSPLRLDTLSYNPNDFTIHSTPSEELCPTAESFWSTPMPTDTSMLLNFGQNFTAPTFNSSFCNFLH